MVKYFNGIDFVKAESHLVKDMDNCPQNWYPKMIIIMFEVARAFEKMCVE